MASSCVDVYVKLSSGRTSTLFMNPSDRVSGICEKIAKEEGVNSQLITLKYQGKVLNRTHTIGYLGIRAETILKGEVSTIVHILTICSGLCPLIVSRMVRIQMRSIEH